MGNNLKLNKRILSLDVFRGITIVLMILVNSQGTKQSYSLLTHAVWDGCTIADLVFPFFLFIVGLTAVVSLESHKNTENRTYLYRNIVQRSMILFCLGLFLNIFPNHFDIDTLRFYGILQRIALCYLICCCIYLNSTAKTQILIFLGILWAYWLVMTQIPVPGFSSNPVGLQGNWVAYFDQKLFSSAHLLTKTYDPEGIFSTIPAIATTLCGALTGTLLLSQLSNETKFYLLGFFGLIFLILGWFWNYSFPINKNLWTSSFVLWTDGCALITFASCFAIIDILGYKKWALPFKIFGMNALFVFMFHVILLKIQFMLFFPAHNDGVINLKGLIAVYLFEGFSNPNISLLYSISFLFLNFLVVLFLYQKRIFFRI